MDERVSYGALAGLFLAQRRRAGETRRLTAANNPSRSGPFRVGTFPKSDERSAAPEPHPDRLISSG